jgi:hypothetical protein
VTDFFFPCDLKSLCCNRDLHSFSLLFHSNSDVPQGR